MSEAESNSPKYSPERARSYKKARLTFFVVGIIFSWISSILFLRSGAARTITEQTSQRVRQPQVSEGATISLFILVSWIASFPLAYLRGHKLEHSYGMSNQTVVQWLGEQLKGLALQLVLLVPLAQVMLTVIRRRPKDWWAVLSAMAVPFSVILAHLAPILILPLFNTYQPLRDQELAGRLRRLAERTGIKVADILEMDMSRQTNAANAFVTGIGNSKRIVLADTLLESLTHDEIETIVAHEIAHQANRDIWRFLLMGTVVATASSFATQRVFDAVNPKTSNVTGIRGAGYTEALPLLSLISSIVGMVTMPLTNAYSRHRERIADRYALELSGNPEAFKSALTKTSEKNLGEEESPRLETILLHSHPSIRERRAACDRYAAEQMAS
jgi:STE24 endopeptidase